MFVAIYLECLVLQEKSTMTISIACPVINEILFKTHIFTILIIDQMSAIKSQKFKKQIL